MPSNQQRREAAKRKLQRQLVRREQARTRRRRTTLVAGSAAALLVAAGVVWLVVSNKNSPTAADTSSSTDASGTATTAAPAVPCTYTAGGTAAKPVKVPANTSPANTGTVAVTMTLNDKPVEITLDRASAPCSVNSFLSLASQGFFNDTSCHRLTKSGALNVLQCGDPSGKGNGGPGYSYEPKAPIETKYDVGTVAMANADGQEGSQFFIVYGPTNITASYSIIGQVSSAGMTVVNDIAAKGVKDDRQDGQPVAPAKIGTVTVPAEAVTASTVWPSSSAAQGSEPAQLPTGAPASSGSAEPTGSAESSGSAQTSGSAAPVSQTTTN